VLKIVILPLLILMIAPNKQNKLSKYFFG